MIAEAEWLYEWAGIKSAIMLSQGHFWNSGNGSYEDLIQFKSR